MRGKLAWTEQQAEHSLICLGNPQLGLGGAVKADSETAPHSNIY